MKRISLIFILGITFFSCNKEEGDSSGNTQFDVSTLLTNAADNIIIPAYEEATASAKQMKDAKDTFVSAPTDVNLENLQTAWKTAFIDWQTAGAFNFGPAEENTFKSILEDINTFPVDESLIEQYITDGDNSLNNFDRDTRGFSAIDYLLYANDQSSTLASFQDDSDRLDYLSAVIDDIYTRIETAKNGWTNGYRDSFVGNTSTSAGSSISIYYNQFLRYYENIKQFKLGLPAGLQVGQSGTQPELLEARYEDDLALDLIEAHLAITEDIWYGRGSDGTDGIGFDDWLTTLGETELLSNTQTSIEEINTAVGNITNVKSDLENNFSVIETAVTEMQEHTRYYKSDLSAVIAISITFNSGDGD